MSAGSAAVPGVPVRLSSVGRADAHCGEPYKGSSTLTCFCCAVATYLSRWVKLNSFLLGSKSPHRTYASCRRHAPNGTSGHGVRRLVFGLGKSIPWICMPKYVSGTGRVGGARRTGWVARSDEINASAARDKINPNAVMVLVLFPSMFVSSLLGREIFFFVDGTI